MSRDPIRLVYLAGCGRSGSTLYGRLLGELEGWLHLGEALRFLFHDGMMARLPYCGCGARVTECPFWAEHLAAIDPQMRRRATEALRLRRLLRPSLLAGGRPVAGDTAMGEAVAATLHRLRDRSGARVLVDGSKNPANGFLVADRDDVELHVLHLVRHPGGVVASWSRPKGYLRGHSTPRILGWWLSANLFADLLGRRAASYHRIRYEEAVADPAGVLNRLRTAVEDPAEAAQDRLPFLDGAKATIGLQHLLAGNPDKMQGGEVMIRDRGWRLGAAHRSLVTIATWPLLLRYGYGLRGVG